MMANAFKGLISHPRTNGIMIGILIGICFPHIYDFVSKNYGIFVEQHLSKGYRVVFVTDEIGFLSENAPVHRNGMKIGIIDKITFNGASNFTITAKIFDGFAIPKASIRTVSETGFSGPRVISISDVNVFPNDEYYQKYYLPSDTINIRFETGLYESLLFKTTVLFSKVDSIYSWNKK